MKKQIFYFPFDKPDSDILPSLNITGNALDTKTALKAERQKNPNGYAVRRTTELVQEVLESLHTMDKALESVKAYIPVLIYYKPGIDSFAFLEGLNEIEYEVLILGHGSEYRDDIRSHNSMIYSECQSITADDLASRLENNGLPKTVKNVTMYACLTAHYTTVGDQVKGFFIGKLVSALSRRGYNDVTVTGYTVPLLAPPSPRTGQLRGILNYKTGESQTIEDLKKKEIGYVTDDVKIVTLTGNQARHLLTAYQIAITKGVKIS